VELAVALDPLAQGLPGVLLHLNVVEFPEKRTPTLNRFLPHSGRTLDSQT
jgi:hypothetical protein